MFRALVICEDFAAGKRAIETCDFLIAQLGDAVDCRSSAWKFDLLQNAKLKEIAAADAIEADVIVIAAREANGLPDAVRSWFEMWVPQRASRAGALVALLDGRGGYGDGASPAYTCLKEVAARAGMDFLPREARFPRIAGSGEKPARDAKKDSSLIGGLVREATPVQHWGLNE